MINIKFKNIKFNFKTIISSLAIIMAAISFSIAAMILYSNTNNYLETKITRVHYSNMNQISQKIELNFSDIENLTKRISSSNVLKDHLDEFKSKKSVTYDNINISQEIRRFMDNAKKYTDGVDSILIITPDENFFVGEREPGNIDYNNVLKTSFYDNLSQNTGKPILMHLDDKSIQDFNNKISTGEYLQKGSTLFASRIVFNKQEYGIIIVKINDNWVKNILDINYRTIIMDNENILWMGAKVDEKSVEDFSAKIENNEEGMFDYTENSKARVFYKKLSFGDWYLLYFDDSDSGSNRLNNIGKLLILSLMFSIAISMALSRLILDKMIEPFKNLIDNVRRYKTEHEYENLDGGKKSRFSMRDRIFWYFALVIIVPLAIFITSYYTLVWNTVNTELIQTQQTAFNQTAENISLFVERKLKAISSMSYDRTIQEALVEEISELNTELLYQVVNGYMLLASGYDEISFYNITNERILSTYNKDIVYDDEVEASLSSVTGKITWLGTKKDELNRQMLSMVVKVNGSDLAPKFSKYLLKHIGNIIISLKESDIEQIYRDIYVKNNANIFIIDNSGYIISNVDKTLIGNIYNGGGNKSTVNSKLDLNNINFNVSIKGTPWVLVGEYGYNSIFEDFKPILYYNFYLLIIVCLLLIIISYIISFKVANSISRMNKLLNGLQLNDISPVFPQDSNITEVDELAGTFNDMITRIDMLIDDLVISKNKQNRLEMQKRDAEILALQSQIKPHFLCNTLESIRCLVKENKETQAVEMLKNLSDLFRYGISKVENLIGIEQELAHALAYTRIMAMRFESINFEWDIEDGIKTYLTPKMILQPIIENAIYHGIVPKKSQGVICISCRCEEKNIIFTVIDDGVGIDEQRLIDLNNTLKNDLSNRIGLQNVQKRLRLYFGEEYDITVESSRGEGTSVIMRIPKIESGSNIL